MNKDNDYIDEIFKDAFEGMEAAPNENLWDNIADDISEEKVDDLFKEAFSNEMAQPSDRVWAGVKENLPLDLRLKRSLNSLSIIAGIIVIGMVIIISLTPSEERKIIIPVVEEKVPEYNIEIAIEETEMEGKEEVIAKKKEIVVEEEKEEGLAIDNSIKNKIKSIELNIEEEEFAFNVDAEKMKGILEPIAPLPVEMAVASVNEGGIIEIKEGIVIPENPESPIIEGIEVQDLPVEIED